MGRRITILGMGPSAWSRRSDIEKWTKGTEVWGLNNGYGTFPSLRLGKKFDRVFELHAWNYLRTWDAGTVGNAKKVDHFAELALLECPVITGQHIPLVQNQEQIDWDAVFRHHFERTLCNVPDFAHPAYFLGSPSIMLALALFEHDCGDTIEYIQSFGIDTSDPDHGQQRASWAFWIAQALARGIKVGGTACDFMAEPEKDGGLDGIREQIAERIRTQRRLGPLTDYVVATRETDTALLARTAESVQAAGKPLHIVPQAETRAAMVASALESAQKPVLWLDCGDELVWPPTMPPCDVGFWANPERAAGVSTHLQVGWSVFACPTRPAALFLQTWKAHAKRTNDHRGLQCAVTELFSTADAKGRFRDVTPHVRGCLRIHPSPEHAEAPTIDY